MWMPIAKINCYSVFPLLTGQIQNSFQNHAFWVRFCKVHCLLEYFQGSKVHCTLQYLYLQIVVHLKICLGDFCFVIKYQVFGQSLWPGGNMLPQFKINILFNKQFFLNYFWKVFCGVKTIKVKVVCYCLELVQ